MGWLFGYTETAKKSNGNGRHGMKRILGKIDSHYKDQIERGEAYKKQLRNGIRAKNDRKLAIILGTLAYRRLSKRK